MGYFNEAAGLAETVVGTCNTECTLPPSESALFRVGNGMMVNDGNYPNQFVCEGERSDALRVYRDGRCATPNT